jgi:hypothetical protein
VLAHKSVYADGGPILKLPNRQENPVVGPAETPSLKSAMVEEWLAHKADTQEGHSHQETRNELKGFLEKLKGRKDVDGSALIEFPTKFQDLISEVLAERQAEYVTLQGEHHSSAPHGLLGTMFQIGTGKTNVAGNVLILRISQYVSCEGWVARKDLADPAAELRRLRRQCDAAKPSGCVETMGQHNVLSPVEEERVPPRVRINGADSNPNDRAGIEQKRIAEAVRR